MHLPCSQELEMPKTSDYHTLYLFLRISMIRKKEGEGKEEERK